MAVCSCDSLSDLRRMAETGGEQMTFAALGILEVSSFQNSAAACQGDIKLEKFSCICRFTVPWLSVNPRRLWRDIMNRHKEGAPS